MPEAGWDDRKSITEDAQTDSDISEALTAMGIITHSWRIIGRFQSTIGQKKLRMNNR